MFFFSALDVLQTEREHTGPISEEEMNAAKYNSISTLTGSINVF